VEVVHSRERSLMSVPFHQRLRLKLQGLFNIVDALLTGWLRILWDRLAGRGRRLDTR
jgi:predicted alpha/beta hydrolase